jgi:transcriptional regulator with XRE-family HTH domain
MESEVFIIAFSKNLKKLRKIKNMSQKDIAELLGITRQAIAAYETGKREPNYLILQKVADIFGVSLDYLLGRSMCKEYEAITIGQNIKLIRENMSYEELSKDIGRKMGILVYAQMLELYELGQRMPPVHILKVISNYAQVRETFFYTPNTMDSYRNEMKLYKMEMNQKISDNGYISDVFIPAAFHLDYDHIKWLSDVANLKYVRIAKMLQESGVPFDMLELLINNRKDKRIIDM